MATPKKLLKANDIFGLSDIETKDIFIPEWKGSVRIKSMTAGDRNVIESKTYIRGKNGQLEMHPDAPVQARMWMVLLCCIDDDGKPLFTAEDFEKLKTKSATAIERLYQACQELSASSEAGLKDAEGN